MLSFVRGLWGCYEKVIGALWECCVVGHIMVHCEKVYRISRGL